MTKHMRSGFAVVALLLVVAGGAAAGKLKKPPLAAKKPVTDTYHGVDVVDDYRWLENGADPEVQAWTKLHSDWARAQLDALPGVDKIAAKLEAIDDAQPVRYAPYRVGKQWYASRRSPGSNQPALMRLSSPDKVDDAKLLFDAATLDPENLTSVDFWVISYDGKKLAVSLSRKGSESGTVYVYDLETGKPLADVIPGVNGGTAGGDVAWLPDSSGFYYTRYPRAGEKPDNELGFWQQVWLHKLGSAPEKDTYALGKQLPKIAEISFVQSDDGKWIGAQVLNGDGGEASLWVLGAGGKWTQVTRFEDDVIQAHFGPDGALYLLSIAGAPRGKILRLAPGVTALAKAKLAVPEAEGRIEEFLVTRSRIHVAALVGGPSELRSHPLDGSAGELVPTAPVSSVYGMRGFDAATGDEILYVTESYVEARSYYRWAPGAGAPVKSPLSTAAVVDFSGYEVERVMATSKDGTQVPINLVHKKGLKRNGKNPTILTGYGGYGISETPFFWQNASVWLERGGVIAHANIRGGAEFGETWHEQGMLTRKQNVFDDFIACAEWLIKEKVTSAKKLAIWGGSNGGLLMGAVMVQRPELFAAVASAVGIYDMLRVELSTNGEFNVTEFGTVKDKAQFDALHAYSPYHHVVDGAKYPPILLTTGENDPRVEPMQSRKFAARLLAAGAKSVWLLTNPDAGHGAPNRKQQFRELAYTFAFTMKFTGMKY